MINYLTILRCYPSTVLACRSVRTFNSLHQSGTRLILRDSNNFGLINKKRFHLTKFSSNKNAADKSGKAKLRASDIQRLLSLAKPEKWKIAGEQEKFSFNFN